MKLPKIIVGLGKTGFSCVRYLVNKGHSIAVVDTRENPPGLDQLRQDFPEVPVYLGALNPDQLKEASELIVSPGLSLHDPAIAAAIAHGIPAIGDIELFARVARAPIIAITGSNAKGTVTTLVENMARCAGLNVQMGGNIGIPALDLLSEAKPDLYVLELSSFQLETTYSLHSTAATILNVTPDHMDRYTDIDAYAAAKQRIYRQCDTAIYNRDDPHSFPTDFFNHKMSFGSSEPLAEQWGLRWHDDQCWLAYGEKRLLSTKELRIKGRHNSINALAALALGSAISLPLIAMLQGLREFRGLPHRCQWIAEHKGVQWYNDSKGTNVGATLAAIEGLAADARGKLILIAGGLAKGADFTPLKQAVANHVKSIVLIGKDASLLEKILRNDSVIIHAGTMKEAVECAQKQAIAGDIILLSPACASLDMFRDYEHRGDEFIAEIGNLV